MSEGLIISGGTLCAPSGLIEDGCVVCIGRRIVFAGPAAALPQRLGGKPTAGLPRYDAQGGYILPGLIDLHVHGGGGRDAMEGTVEALAQMAEAHAAHGTTGFLATTATAPAEDITRAAHAVRAALDAQPGGGARILGLHLEGPYINEARVGAQNPAYVRPPSLEELEALCEILQDGFRRITIAPEVPGALQAISWLAERGIGVSMGHTAATYEEALAGVDAGARYVTHMYNAMSPLHHRAPGVVGAALADERITAELIADGIHVHPGAMRALWAAKGWRRITLITDAIMAMGQPPGRYAFGGLDIVVADGAARLAEGDSLAGSILTMAGAIKSIVGAGIPLFEAVQAASLVPAEAAGWAHRKGRLRPGFDADIAVLDADLACRFTVVEGEPVFKADAAA